MLQYPVKLELRLDWSEMDLFGHINNVSYFKYVQASRVNYWEAIGLNKLLSDDKIGPILASTSCKFVKPLFYPGSIIIEASIESIRTTSFTIQHRILNTEGDVAATAEDIVVVYDFGKNQKMAIPEDVRKKIEELEGRDFKIS